MRMGIKNVIIFTTGLIVGGAAGVLGTQQYWKRHFNEKADAEIEEMREWYKQKIEELNILVEEPAAEEKSFSVKEEEEVISDPPNRAEKVKTDYKNMYSKNKKIPERSELTSEEKEEIAAEQESPTEDDEETMEKLAEKATENHRKNREKKPKIISVNALGELPGYIEMKTLLFYTIDEIVTDEEDVIVEDPELLLGDCLVKYNFRESDEDVIFVQNFEQDTVYEVQKINGEFD